VGKTGSFMQNFAQNRKRKPKIYDFLANLISDKRISVRYNKLIGRQMALAIF
jgi:hypothetical protein